VVFVCVLLSAFALGNLVNSARASETQTPGKVILSPKDPAVIIGKKQAFIATVLDTKGNKMKTVVPLTWSLASTVPASCSIDQNGVLTVAGSVLPGTFAKSVTAAVSSETHIVGTAGFSVIDSPFTGGVFIGTLSCTAGKCAGSIDDLVLNAQESTFAALLIFRDKPDFPQFEGVINQKKNSVSAVFGTYTVKGKLNYANGIVTGMSGTCTNSAKGTLSTWTVALATNAAAGGKVGSWEISATESPKAAGLTGQLAAIFKDDGTIVAVAKTKENGQLVGGISVPGTWGGHAVSFPSFVEGGEAANASTHAIGTYDNKKASGNMLNGSSPGVSRAVGNWKLSDI
jgi:hypothetical protein